MNRNLKRPYTAIDVKLAKVGTLLEASAGKRFVVAIDVAKEKMVASVLDETQAVLTTVKWSHPKESEMFYSFVDELAAKRPTDVALESTGTYGDALCSHLLRRKLPVFYVSPKLVHDARELYDGVPSSHDAKAAGIIGMLHLQGRSREYEEKTVERRELQALLGSLYRYDKQYVREKNQLSALLARHWPGLFDIVSLNTRSILSLLKEMGSPEVVAANKEASREILLRTSANLLSETKIEAILDNAVAGYGEPLCDGEVEALKLLAADVLATRDQIQKLRRQITARAKKTPSVKPMIAFLGAVTAAALFAELGDIRNYSSPAALVRAMGLNLKEASSGQLKGRLRMTKRGPSRARHYLFFTALRMIYRDPIIAAWHAKKRLRDADKGLLGVIAVMRKLTRALWHVARGATFDASKLYDVHRLKIVPKDIPKNITENEDLVDDVDLLEESGEPPKVEVLRTPADTQFKRRSRSAPEHSVPSQVQKIPERNTEREARLVS